ncbi:MAG: S41 family peptidase [Candidatus Eremiobacteraeota bacterium]|nr:S41 family peptidase [Candidatus Eremiobacteraeota bacterium]
MRSFLVAALVAALIVPAPPVRAAGDSLSQLERIELQISYLRLTGEFYQKVDSQTLLDGAYQKIVSDLDQKGVAHPALAETRATYDARTDAAAFMNEVGNAYALAGGKLTSTQLTYDAIGALLAAAKDRYTVFLTPKEYAEMTRGLAGGEAFGGVGLYIGAELAGEKRAVVLWVVQGAPADRAGIQQGDVMVSIDGKSTAGLETKDVSALLKGQPGTKVRVAVERDGSLLSDPIEIVRREVHAPTVLAKTLPGNIGFVAITVFGQSTSDELSRALAKFERAGVQAYVLDLRDNGGGYLDAAIDVSSKFIATGPIVRVTERGGATKQYDADNAAIPPKPLAVLVNKNTASASEITSGAIQDRGVGTIVGTRTFGKGVVQSICPLPDGSAIKITTARYFTPRGRDINSIGIQPDIATEENPSPVIGDPAKDAQLQAALIFLQQKVARAN